MARYSSKLIILFWAILIFSIVGLLALGIFLAEKEEARVLDDTYDRIRAHVSGATLDLYIADTPLLRTRGLSNIKTLPENEGMVFVFEKPKIYEFWMKDMHFSLDALWLDQEYRVVDITKNQSPLSFPNTFSPRTPAQYVIEVNAGWADAHDVAIGDVVSFGQRNNE